MIGLKDLGTEGPERLKVIQGAKQYVPEIHVAGKMDRDIAATSDKARREIGYGPRIDLREGTRRAIAWCRANGELI